jgi:hypothetical protein
MRGALDQTIIEARRLPGRIIDFWKETPPSELFQAGVVFAATRGNPVAKPSFSATKRFVKDFDTKNTKNWSAMFKSEGEARALAREQLGANAVEVEANKWRSADGKWQYRAKPGDVSDNHIHLEELNPNTGEVLQNLHLRWPEGAGR